MSFEPSGGAPAFTPVTRRPRAPQLPTVLAGLGSGEVRAMDLRMLERSAWHEWPLVVGTSRGADTSGHSSFAPPQLAVRAPGVAV